MMKSRTWTILTLGLLAAAGLPCPAQERPPNGEPVPAPKGPLDPCCGNKYLWVDYFVPVQTLYARDHVVKKQCSTWVVKFKEEDQTFTDYEVRPREVTKEVTYCADEPVTTIDPVTGQTTTCTQQVTRTKTVKETIFESVPVKRVLKVPRPILAQETAEYEHVTTIYEWKTDMVRKGCVVSMPGGEVANKHDCVVGPKADCKP
jgi:hypothetical protein